MKGFAVKGNIPYEVTKSMKRISRSFAAAMAAAGMLVAADLPVRHVVLYKHGVAFFERSGDLASGESAKLDFKSADMNDVLKSLTVNEAGGGKVTGVRYDSSQPLQNRLADFPFHLADKQSLALFLDQLKGARVELQYGNAPMKASIVSGRITDGKDNQPQKEMLVVLTESGDLRTIDLSAVAAMRLADPSLQLQLREYLTAVSNSRNKDQRSVYIDSADKRGRKISASYMIPMPAWKSSYRLIFPPSGDATLEGWAIIDNTTADDWTNIKLAVVSGRPISFQTRLYDPKFMMRPYAELAEDRAVRPEVYESAMMNAPQPAQMRAMSGMGGGVIGGVIGGVPGLARKSLMATDSVQVAPSSVSIDAAGRDMGELFEYSFATPVTVKRNESAMLPFLQQTLGSRKLLIYSDHSVPNPRNAAELTNATGKTLDGGPITVYDQGAYAGEALMETLKSSDKRLISYGIDLGTRIGTALDSSDALVREVHSRKGVTTAKTVYKKTTNYTIKNADARAKTLLIERPIRGGYKVMNQKPVETTTTAWRFEVKLGPNASETFPVIEELLLNESLDVSSITNEQLSIWIQNKAISAGGRQALERIAMKKDEIAVVANEMNVNDVKINEVIKDQERLRQNLGSLNRVGGQQELVQKYVRDLSSQETQIAQLRDKISEQRTRKNALESELQALIDKLEF